MSVVVECPKCLKHSALILINRTIGYRNDSVTVHLSKNIPADRKGDLTVKLECGCFKKAVVKKCNILVDFIK